VIGKKLIDEQEVKKRGLHCFVERASQEFYVLPAAVYRGGRTTAVLGARHRAAQLVLEGTPLSRREVEILFRVDRRYTGRGKRAGDRSLAVELARRVEGAEGESELARELARLVLSMCGL
jgi:hypothetical protein